MKLLGNTLLIAAGLFALAGIWITEAWVAAAPHRSPVALRGRSHIRAKPGPTPPNLPRLPAPLQHRRHPQLPKREPMKTVTPRWKVKKLEDGRWLAHRPGCPPREHLCWRWITGNPNCTIRATLPEAYKAAANRYAEDERERYLRETPGRYTYADLGGDTHLHTWTRLFDQGRSYVGCGICREPGPR